MAKINIAGVSSGSKSYTAHIVLTDEHLVDDQPVISVLGEAFVEIPEATKTPDVKKLIIDAATKIMKRHQDALHKAVDLKDIDFPPIV